MLSLSLIAGDPPGTCGEHLLVAGRRAADHLPRSRCPPVARRSRDSRPLVQCAGALGHLEDGLRIGSRYCVVIGHVTSRLQFPGQLAQDIVMRFAVDLAIQDLLGTRNGNRRDLAAQFLTRPVGFLFDLGLGCDKLAFAFLDPVFLALRNDRVGPACAWSRMPVACFLASATMSPAWASACSSLCWPLSAAARPSSICACRSSSATRIGGHMNFIQNQTNTIMAIVWPKRVIFIST